MGRQQKYLKQFYCCACCCAMAVAGVLGEQRRATQRYREIEWDAECKGKRPAYEQSTQILICKYKCSKGLMWFCRKNHPMSSMIYSQCNVCHSNNFNICYIFHHNVIYLNQLAEETKRKWYIWWKFPSKCCEEIDHGDGPCQKMNHLWRQNQTMTETSQEFHPINKTFVQFMGPLNLRNKKGTAAWNKCSNVEICSTPFIC